MNTRLNRYFILSLCCLGFLLTGETLLAEDAAPKVKSNSNRLKKTEYFENEIRPILSKHCWDCHSELNSESDLKLDSLAGMLTGGTRGPAILMGKGDESLLVQALRHGEAVRMPPKTKLSPVIIAKVVKWIDQGAAWPNTSVSKIKVQRNKQQEPVWTEEQKSFWSLKPPVKPQLPSVSNEDRIQHPIDAFILSRLEQKSLLLSARADKRTLIRRATFDLIGLPPTPKEVEDFLNDKSPDAFSKVVDRLLSSPHYGERWGRHWLDVARYADSNGLDENLAYANAFRYRDYVVNAFNRDLPFNQFLREQIAGDLLTDAAAESRSESDQIERLIATGFLSLGAKMLAEDDPVKMQMDIIDEQINTIGQTFMGLTLGCARCHDHKFDPVSMHDYYGLAGIFKSTKTMENFKVVAKWQERPLATPDAIQAQVKHQNKLDSVKEEIQQLLSAERERLQQQTRNHVGDYLLAAMREMTIEQATSQRTPVAMRPEVQQPAGMMIVEAENYDRGNVLKDTTNWGKGIGVLVNRGERPNFTEYDLTLPNAGFFQFDIRYAAESARPVKLFINGKLVTDQAASKTTGSWYPKNQKWFTEGLFQFEKKTVIRFEQPDFFPHIDKFAITPVRDKSLEQRLSLPLLTPTFRPIPSVLKQCIHILKEKKHRFHPVFAEGIDLAGSPITNEATTNQEQILKQAKELQQRYRELNARLSEEGTKTENKTAQTKNNPDSQDTAIMLQRDFLTGTNSPFRIGKADESFLPQPIRRHLKTLRSEEATLSKSVPTLPMAMAVSEGGGIDERIHPRGSHLTKGDLVKRRFPSVFQLVSQAAGHDDLQLNKTESGRLQLANWLASSSHPLTARVIVNRVWLWHFGDGLVRTPDNFGRLGELPTHPKLLDWLTVRFIEKGWSIKELHRMILSSSTWQQQSLVTSQMKQNDPENRLYARMNRLRLDAESVRDSLLVVSGTLDRTMKGSLLPTKNRAYVTSTANVNPDIYQSKRRSVYLPVVRSALFDLFQTFDFADPTMINGKRQSTTIAPQALFMMNSAFMNQQAELLAKRLLDLAANSADDRTRTEDRRYRRLWMLVYSRLPSESELSEAKEYRLEYKTAFLKQFPNSKDAELKSWQSLCRAVLSSNEFLFVN